MSIIFLAALLVSSPYPFELRTGFSFEPVAEYLFKDQIDKEKVVGGVRLSYLYSEPSDTIITAEIQFTTATQFETETTPTRGSENTMITDYLFETGFVFYEIYHPVAFRLAGGGGVELRREASPCIYYRGGLGYYFSKSIGAFLDVGSRFIFRSDEKLSMPINVGGSLQILF